MNNKLIAHMIALAIAALAAGGVEISAQEQEAKRTAAYLLHMADSQVLQLEQLLDFLHGRRQEEELKLGRQKSPTGKSRAAASEGIRQAFETVQREARKLLGPGQAYLLEERKAELAVAPDAAIRLLFIGTLDEFLAMPLNEKAAKRWRDAKESERLQLASPYAAGPYWQPGYAVGFGLGHGHHWHLGHLHHHTGMGHGGHLGHGGHGGHAGHRGKGR